MSTILDYTLSLNNQMSAKLQKMTLVHYICYYIYSKK